VLHAARWKCRTQKSPNNLPSAHHRTTLSGCIVATEAHIVNRKKNLVKHQRLPHMYHNMANFGALAAEIVWGTTANFNGFRVLAPLLHGTLAVGVSRAAIVLVIGQHSSSFFFLSSLFLAYSQRSEIGCRSYFHTWCGLSANLECRSEVCCTRIARNTGRKNDAKSPSAHQRTILSGCIFATKALCDTLICGALEEHLLTYLLTYQQSEKTVKEQYLLYMS